MKSRKVKLCKIRLQRVKEVSHLPFYDQINYESEFVEEDEDQYVTSESVKVCNYTKCKFEKCQENCGDKFKLKKGLSLHALYQRPANMQLQSLRTKSLSSGLQRPGLTQLVPLT